MPLICKSNGHFTGTRKLTSIEAPSLLAFRRDPRLLKFPPYISTICILVGVAWLLLLPLNEYSRHTYISENALLPGQVHTYFGGSEQHVFNAYKNEIQAVAGKEQPEYVGFILSGVELADWKMVKGYPRPLKTSSNPWD